MKKLIKLFCLLLCAAILLCGCSDNSTSDTDKVMVYITRTGIKYHTEHCTYLNSSKIQISLQEAVEEYYSPCSRCNPPTIKNKSK